MLAGFRARYQFVKKLFIAVGKKSVCRLDQVDADERRSECTIEVRHDVEDLRSDVPIHCQVLTPCTSLRVDLCTIASRRSVGETQEAFIPSFADLAAVCSILIFVTGRGSLIPIREPGGQVEPLPA